MIWYWLLGWAVLVAFLLLGFAFGRMVAIEEMRERIDALRQKYDDDEKEVG